MKKLIHLPQFYFFELACISLAVVLWAVFPGQRWQPLLIAITPWLLRLIAGSSPIKRTPLDIPILLFLISSAVGVWAAYQPEDAWAKFWLIVAAILFYYLLARQNVGNLYHTAAILSLLGFGMGIYFFLTNNWEQQQVKFEVISQLGAFWMRIRPDIGLPALHPNDIAGIAGLTLPFSLALTHQYLKRRSLQKTIFFGLVSLVILAAILFSASRGSWMALLITAGVWVLWAATMWFSKSIKLSARLLFPVFLGCFAILIAGYLWTSLHGRINQIAIGDTASSVSANRFHVFWSTLELIRDVPYTGAGLDSFSGQYSSYILLNPNYVLGYAHNIFLDISVQQGILGGLSFLLIYFGSLLLLILRPARAADSMLHNAIISSTLIILLHSLVDVLLYRTLFTALLFFLPGMAVGLTQRGFLTVPSRFVQDRSALRRSSLPMLLITGFMFVGIFAVKKPLLAAWYTNLGTIEMSKVELADFPTGHWDEGRDVNSLNHAESLFLTALAVDPSNPSANYRLGLISLSKRDYPAAIQYLEVAYQGNPNHRGILKALGYSYLWNGQLEAARLFLTSLPETQYEVGNYIAWWSVNNRPDLASTAEKYFELSQLR